MFIVPLYEEGGFAYGYVTASRKDIGNLYNIYDCIGACAEIPEDIEDRPLIVRDMFQNSTPFLQTVHNPRPWLESPRKAVKPLPAKRTKFISGDNVVDMTSDTSVPATLEDVRTLSRNWPLHRLLNTFYFSSDGVKTG